MTDLIRWRTQPGSDGYQQPKHKVLWRQDQPLVEFAGRGTGHPNDQGRSQWLIHPSLNGSPDVEFWVGIFQMNPGEYHPLHHHPNGAEFYYVISGEAEFQVDDELVKGAPGLMMYFSRFTKHSVRVTGTSKVEVMFGFSPPDWPTVGVIWDE